MNISVNISVLDTAVRRQLSVIGKRAVTKEGEKLFSNVTPSSAEEAAIRDFYTDAVMLLNTTSQNFVTAATTPAFSPVGLSPEGAVTLTFPTNHNDAMNSTITVAFTTFLVAYAVYAWLEITYPAAVERYKQAMQEKLEALIMLIFHKAPPQHQYTYDLPPVLSIPGNTITLADGQQQLFGYALGSDGIDDLQMTSTSPEIVVVTKNATNRIFSIANVQPSEADNPTTATVTVYRSTTNEVLVNIAVTALPADSSLATVAAPVLLGYRNISDTITLKERQTIQIGYTGTLLNVVSSNEDIAIATLPSGTNYISIHANAVGSATITIYGDNDFVYRLYVNVEAVAGTSPTIDVASPVALSVGGSPVDILYTLGSDGFDDLVATVTELRPSGVVTVTKDTEHGKFTVSCGESLTGTAVVKITSARHPEVNTSFSVVVTNPNQVYQPSIFPLATGETINLTVGEDMVIDYFPGSSGTMAVSKSGANQSAISVDPLGDEAVVITALSAAASGVTITFTNSTMSWSQSFSVVVADRPAVVVQPRVFWPDSLTLYEGRNEATTIGYTLGNDNTDDLVFSIVSQNNLWGENNAVVTLGTKNTTAHTIAITPGAAGTATIRAARKRQNESSPYLVLGDYQVNVYWVEPFIFQPMSYQDNDEIQLDADETYSNFLKFTEASHGTTQISVVPSQGLVSFEVTSETSNGWTTKTVSATTSANSGFAYMTLSNGSWQRRLILRVGDVQSEQPTPTVQPTVSGNTYRSINSGNSDLIGISNGNAVSVSSSNSSYLAASVSNGSVIVTALTTGTAGTRIASVTITTNEGTTLQVVYTITEISSGSGSGSSQAIPEYDSGIWQDKPMYYKGIVEGITNPVFYYHNSQVEICVDLSDSSKVICYNESTGECSSYYSDEIPSIAIYVETLINLDYDTNGVSSAGTTSEDPSELGSEVYAYITDDSGSGGSSGGSLSPGLYYYPYTFPNDSTENIIFEVLSGGGVRLVLQGTSGSNIFYYWKYESGQVSKGSYAGSTAGEAGAYYWPSMIGYIESATHLTRTNPSYITQESAPSTPSAIP